MLTRPIKMTQLNIPPAQRIEQIDLFIWYDLLSSINKQYFIINCNNSKLLHAAAHMVHRLYEKCIPWRHLSLPISGGDAWKKNSFSYASGFLLDDEPSPSECRRDATFSQSTICFRNNNKLCSAHMCRGFRGIRFMTCCHILFFLLSGPDAIACWWKVLTRPEA